MAIDRLQRGVAAAAAGPHHSEHHHHVTEARDPLHQISRTSTTCQDHASSAPPHSNCYESIGPGSGTAAEQ